jgi:hypothetical protein
MDKETKLSIESLVGDHVLTGVRIEDKYETPDHYTVCRFTLDGVTYEITEDPCDGYRNYVRSLAILNVTALVDFRQHVVCSMKPDDNYSKNATLQMKVGDFVLFEIGEDNWDDYYPAFVCNFNKSFFEE